MLKYRLPAKLPDEKIVKVVRRDYFVLFRKILFFSLLAVLPLAFFYLMLTVYPELLNGVVFYPLIILSTSAYYLFIWLFFFFSFIDYYLDIWIITNKRIIDVRQQGFFSRIVSELKLDKIQDISSEMHGFFPSVFKYGDVHVQTAGELFKFDFQEIPRPEEIRSIIVKLAAGKK